MVERSGANSFGSYGFFTDPLLLPTTGTYQVLYDPRDTQVGSLDLKLHDVPPDPSVTLNPGNPVTVSTTAAGQNIVASFSGTVNQRISVLGNNTAFTGRNVRLFKPDESQLWEEIYNPDGFFTDVLSLPATGTYQLNYSPLGTQTGSITLALYNVPADASVALTPGNPQTATTTTPGQNIVGTFSGAAGQQVQLVGSTSTFGNRTVRVLKPDGSELWSEIQIGGGFSTGTLTLPTAGTYQLLYNPADEQTGSLTVTLTNVTGGGPPDAPLGTAGEESPDEGNPSLPGPLVNSTACPAVAPVAPAGITALEGTIQDLSGAPLPCVSLEMEGLSGQSDRSGRFVLVDVEPGHHELVVDGRTANRRGVVYGVFEVGVTVEAGGTNVLPYTLWLPQLDKGNAVRLPRKISREIVITNPRIPGLELHIPAGARITDEEGERVREIGITPVPTDRPPFPLPTNINVPQYFTIQPGGAYVSGGGAWLVYPNSRGLSPGSEVDFWNYDPEGVGWHIYGQGTVTADGSQIAARGRTRLYEFTGAMFGNQTPPGSGPLGPEQDGDPINLATGMFVLDKTDLVLPGTMPLSVTRTYRSGDPGSRAFGRGSTWVYDMFLWSAQQYSEVDLILPSGGRIHYLRTSSGTGFTDAVFRHAATPGTFYSSTIRWNGRGWDLRLRDGTTLIFGENAPLQAIRDRFGNQVTLLRSSQGQIGQGLGQTGLVVQANAPDGRWIRFGYDSANRVTSARDGMGRTVSYQYDTSGRLWKVTDPEGGVTEYTYDASHRMLTIKDARGITFLTNEYNAADRVTKQTQADGTAYQFAYTLDGSGKVTRTDVTDPRGNIRRVTFNGDGYSLTDRAAHGDPEQQTLTYQREAGSNALLAVTDELGRVTDFDYDSRGNVTAVTKLAGTGNAVTTEATYESVYNQVTSITDPLDHTTTYAYDAVGRLTTISDARNKDTTFTYDSAGRPLTMTDPTNRTTTLTYELGDLATVTDPLGNRLRTLTDAGGRVRVATDALGARTRTGYDNLNRPTTVNDALSGTTSFSWDANGNLLALTDPRNGVTTYTYDSMDRVDTRTDPMNQDESFDYDGVGNLVSHTDRRNKTTATSYDALNRRTFLGFGQNGATYESSISYSYDDGNRMTQLVDSAAGTMSFAYDGLDRLTTETTSAGSVTYTYDAADRLASTLVSGQPSATYTYDVADRLTQIVRGGASVAFTYDDADRELTRTLPNGILATSAYDGAGRLGSLAYTMSGSAVGDLTYQYDANGRRTGVGGSLARTGMPAAVSSASYNAANRLTAWAGTAMSYDLAGNLTSDGTRSYTWNARGELTQVATGGIVNAAYAYDGLGRRTTRTIAGSATAIRYDGANTAVETTGGVGAGYFSSGLDQMVRRTESGAIRTYLTDALGSTVALTDGPGAMVTSYTYEPFGKSSVSGATSGNPVRFTGREHEGVGDLAYYRARYYNATWGRFISEDPIGFAGGDVNLYAYVGNDPVNATDPYGLDIVGGCVTVQVVFIIFPVQGSVCRVVSEKGQTGTTLSAGFGIGIGIQAGGGAGPLTADPDYIEDLGGGFTNVGGGGGAGPTLIAEGFVGKGLCGQRVGGGTATVGPGAGAQLHLTTTYTFVLKDSGPDAPACSDRK